MTSSFTLDNLLTHPKVIKLFSKAGKLFIFTSKFGGVKHCEICGSLNIFSVYLSTMIAAKLIRNHSSVNLMKENI